MVGVLLYELHCVGNGDSAQQLPGVSQAAGLKLQHLLFLRLCAGLHYVVQHHSLQHSSKCESSHVGCTGCTQPWTVYHPNRRGEMSLRLQAA